MRRLLLAALVLLAACGDGTGPSAGRLNVSVLGVTSSALPGDSTLVTLTVGLRSGNNPASAYWASTATAGTVTPKVARTDVAGHLVVVWRAPKAGPGDYLELRGCVSTSRGACTDEPSALMSVTGS